MTTAVLRLIGEDDIRIFPGDPQTVALEKMQGSTETIQNVGSE
jgi:hypothetical protein